ncbi:hypothetical protein GCM10010302_35880 [Streptomyces polychromogenes]|uniref:YrdC-like domain-containing protein n=1 Tax=Streptomyces polychromogenes TaxID=67342 RepID=A0ABN0VEW3_9ACTN
MTQQRTTESRQPTLENPGDVRAAARSLAEGRAVAHGFGNFYALTARPDREVVERVNRMKGRPPAQVASVTTVRAHMPSLFDWSRLPTAVRRRQVEDLIEDLFSLGPFGFRGPAATRVPGHLTAVQDGVPTVRLIAPGHRCPSNGFLAEALDRTDGEFLAVTSLNPSRHRTGAEHEPAHWRAEGVLADFGREPGVTLLAHDDEAAARHRHPHHAPTSTTVLSFHHTTATGRSGLPALTLERHGSLSASHTRAVAANHGFALTLAPRAHHRLPARTYPTPA